MERRRKRTMTVMWRIVNRDAVLVLGGFAVIVACIAGAASLARQYLISKYLQELLSSNESQMSEVIRKFDGDEYPEFLAAIVVATGLQVEHTIIRDAIHACMIEKDFGASGHFPRRFLKTIFKPVVPEAKYKDVIIDEIRARPEVREFLQGVSCNKEYPSGMRKVIWEILCKAIDGGC